MAHMISIPPPPRGEDESSWQDWYIRVRNAINLLSRTLTWLSLDFTGSNITDILTRNHTDLQNISGGSTGNYYHLTSTQHTDLTDGGNTTLHTHDIYDFYKDTVTINFPSILANSISVQDVTVTGALAGYPVILGPPSGLEAGLIFSAYVSSDDTVSIRLYNTTGSSIDPASADWTVGVLKSI